ncbi:unnamed protein product [Chrysoparadoxa australica]
MDAQNPHPGASDDTQESHQLGATYGVGAQGWAGLGPALAEDFISLDHNPNRVVEDGGMMCPTSIGEGLIHNPLGVGGSEVGQQGGIADGFATGSMIDGLEPPTQQVQHLLQGSVMGPEMLHQSNGVDVGAGPTMMQPYSMLRKDQGDEVNEYFNMINQLSYAQGMREPGVAAVNGLVPLGGSSFGDINMIADNAEPAALMAQFDYMAAAAQHESDHSWAAPAMAAPTPMSLSSSKPLGPALAPMCHQDGHPLGMTTGAEVGKPQAQAQAHSLQLQLQSEGRAYAHAAERVASTGVKREAEREAAAGDRPGPHRHAAVAALTAKANNHRGGGGDGCGKKRRDRNAREQRRSMKISQQIDTLRVLLHDSGVHVKSNKGLILNRVADHVRELQARVQQMESERQKWVVEVAAAKEQDQLKDMQHVSFQELFACSAVGAAVATVDGRLSSCLLFYLLSPFTSPSIHPSLLIFTHYLAADGRFHQ